MPFQIRRMRSLAVIATLLLAACAGPSTGIAPTAVPVATPTSLPATAFAPPTAASLPPTASSAPTEQPTAAPLSATEPPITAATATLAPAVGDQTPATVDGQVVLQLSAGADANQVGIINDGSTVTGPRSFRIGA